ncbi:MAG: hypothetical protein CL666_05410 [Balneola sp.]|nr:hypothetical protein [Balneola sp.]
MAYVRWLYKSWNIFWTFIGVLILSVAIISGASFGVMQLQPVKNYIAEQLEDQFAEQYEGVISIGNLGGLLPLNVEMEDVRIYPNKQIYKPVFQTETISARVDVWSLLQNRLFIHSVGISSPNVIVDPDSSFSIEKAFLRTSVQQSSTSADSVSAAKHAGFPFQIIAPSMQVNNGTISIFNTTDNSPDSMTVRNLNMSMFFEFTDEQRFLDIDELRFDLPELDIEQLQAFGQIYNDDRFFEINALTINHKNSSIRFNGEVDGVDFLKGNIPQQLETATFSYLIDRISLTPQLLSSVVPQTDDYLTTNVMGTIEGSGNLDSLSFSPSEIIVGESFIRFDGGIKNYDSPEALSYNLNVPQFSVSGNEMNSFSSFLNDTLQQTLAETNLEGSLSGNSDQTKVRFSASHFERGEVELNGEFTWGNDIGFKADFRTSSLNIGNLTNAGISSSDLTLTGEISSSSLDVRKSRGGLTLRSERGAFDGRAFDQLAILASWENGFIQPDLTLNVNDARLTARGQIDLSSETPEYVLRGSASNLELDKLIFQPQIQPVTVNLEYNANVRGQKLEDLYGQVSVDVLKAAFENDTLGRHQFYADFAPLNESEKELRFTSTAFDANMSGTFEPATLLDLAKQWKQYFSERYRDELAMDTTIAVKEPSLASGTNQDFSISLNFKNLALINTYLPEFPRLASTGRLSSTVNVNNQRLLFNTAFIDSETKIEGFEADSMNIQATGRFRIGERLKDFSGLQMQMSASHLNYRVFDSRDFQMTANLEQQAVNMKIQAEKLAEEASFVLDLNGAIQENQLTFNISDLDLSSDAYQWRNLGEPTVRYHNTNRLTFRDFQFESDSQFVQIDGTFSSSPEDSVNYEIRSLDLGKISDILDIRIDFAGQLNGNFTTTTLTTIPTIDGNVDIEGVELDNTLYGDLNINSTYNPELQRFDTKIISTTDSVKYPQYFRNSDRRGQFFQIEGYVLAPEGGNFPQADSIFAFDVNFDNIDLWILPLIGPKVFDESAGIAEGTGTIWGNLDTFDYEANFAIGNEDAAFIRPKFLETDYYAQGDLTWNRSRGFIFHDIFLIDPSGGNAILSGFYDVNDFAPLDTMNINLDMDEFQFLNSSFDPTVAFFGTAYGTGRVNISGTNLAPVLSTPEPVVVTDFSEISIPLLEETEFDEDNRFIRFVNSFDDEGISNSTGRFTSQNGNGVPGLNAEEVEQLSFAERFTLDLQFEARNPMNVRMIFDPVTGDIITAQGTGRLRILLEDEQVSMFGRFDISGGRYQFVSGDIFTRRFEIASGGTIVWEGDPANARLDVNAIYSARPDINTLSGTGARDPENAQRVPVELVLNIGGTLTSIENNFFFRLPNTFESQQNSTLSTQLASINRDENLKLIQATNFMLMGDFIPVSSAGGAQTNLLTENLSGSAALLNPLLSSQVINPLLSNQVNSLLNSDLSSLDVDFNLNTYNQVDLGVALRLYNDKLILRREGQITGRQSNIGDLGATYRINQTFAVTAFHRQDLTFGNLSSTEQSQQSQEINGVGLEAKVSFNTWNDFFNRLFAPFRKLFGTKEEQKQEEITENR